MKKPFLVLALSLLFQFTTLCQTPQDNQAKAMTDKYVAQIESNITLEDSEKDVLASLKLINMKELIDIHTNHKDDPDVAEQRKESVQKFIAALRDKLGVKRANVIIKAGQPKQ